MLDLIHLIFNNQHISLQSYQQLLKIRHLDIYLLIHMENTHQLNHLIFLMIIYFYMDKNSYLLLQFHLQKMLKVMVQLYEIYVYHFMNIFMFLVLMNEDHHLIIILFFVLYLYQFMKEVYNYF